MKVPVGSNDQNCFTENTLSCGSGGNLWYEPKSVLDIVSDDPLDLASDHLPTNFDDWDSFMRELGLQDDRKSDDNNNNNILFNPTESLTHHLQLAHSPESTQFLSHSDFYLSPESTRYGEIGNNLLNESWSFGYDSVDELVQLAECFDTNSGPLAGVILGRLDQKLSSVSDMNKPLQRAAFYFKEALRSQLTGSTRYPTRSPSFFDDVVQTILAYKIFSNISPIPMFSGFTANQAVLEAVDGSSLVHVIDFDIGFGSHWASFIKELADRVAESAAKPPILRITAIVPDDYAAESRLVGDNLTQFALELDVGLDIDFVSIQTFELLSFKAVKFIDGEKIAVLLSPAIFRRVAAGPFAADLRRVSPDVVVHVDNEGAVAGRSVRQAVIEGLEFYSSLIESLEAANVDGSGGDLIKKIEDLVLFPKISEAVAAARGGGGMTWKEAFVAAGFRPVRLSQFAEFQASCLLGRLRIGGFHVAKRHAEMMLCWRDRALVATSAWS